MPKNYSILSENFHNAVQTAYTHAYWTKSAS